MDYSASQKRYPATPQFEPKLIAPNAERYLAQLRAISDGVITLADTATAGLPDLGVMPVPGRRLDPLTLRAFLKAVNATLDQHRVSVNERS